MNRVYEELHSHNREGAKKKTSNSLKNLAYWRLSGGKISVSAIIRTPNEYLII